MAGHDDQGNPIYSKGEPAVAERNLLRYYFAFAAFFKAADEEDRARRHTLIVQGLGAANALTGGDAGHVGAVAMVVVGNGSSVDSVEEIDDFAVVELLVLGIDPGIDDADADRASEGEARTVDGEIQTGIVAAEVL